MLREVDYGGDDHSSWFQLKRKCFFSHFSAFKRSFKWKKKCCFRFRQWKISKKNLVKKPIYGTVFITWMRSLGSILMFVLTSKKSLIMMRSKLNQLGWSHSNVFVLSLDLNWFEQNFFFFPSQKSSGIFWFPKHHVFFSISKTSFFFFLCRIIPKTEPYQRK